MLALDMEWWKPNTPKEGQFRCASWMDTSNERLFGTFSGARALQEIEKHRVFCGHNVTSDLSMAVKWGATLHKQFQVVDTLLMARLLFPLLPAKGLKPFGRIFGLDLVDLHDVEDTGVLLDYCGKDTEAAYRLYEVLRSEAKSEKALISLEAIGMYFQIERAFMMVELAGMKLDLKFLEAEETRLHYKMLKYVQQISDPLLITNDRMFLSALSQVYPLALLEEYLERNETGLGVKADNVRMLPDPPPWLETLIEARECNQYKTLYVDNPLKYGGYIDAHYNLGDTKTHRRSTTPTIQNWPGGARRAVVSRYPNGCIVSADEKNLEARIMGWQAKCPLFVQDMVERGYIGVAARCFGAEIKDKKDPRYRKIKSTVLAVTYNMKPSLYVHREWVEGQGKEAKRSWKEGQKDYDLFFSRYPELHTEIERRKAFGWEHGYTDTWCGAYLKLPIFDPTLLQVRGYDEKKIARYRSKIDNFCVNWPTQSFASYVTGCALNDLIDSLVEEYSKGHYGKYSSACFASRSDSSRNVPVPIGEVHDELIVDTPKEKLDEVQAMMRTAMTAASSLRVLAPDFPKELLDVEFTVKNYWSKE